MSLNDLRKKQVSGFYLDVPVTPGEGKSDSVTDEIQRIDGVTPSHIDYDATLLECHVNLDLEGFEEVDEDGNPMYVKVLDNSDPANPVMVDSDERLVAKGLKSNWIAQVKATAGGLLAGTDWMVIRKAERDVPIDADVVTKRAAILAEANRLENAIAACTTVEELIAVVTAQNWE